MVVDDEPGICYLFQLYLEEYGYYVDVYNDPLEALTEFKSDKCKLVILDVKMPYLNSFELYEVLRRIDGNCKFCFVTAFESYYGSLKEFFPTIDVSCFIKKPVTKKELLARIAIEMDS